MRVAPEIILMNDERAELTKLAQRARIVLLAAQGMWSKDIALALGQSSASLALARTLRSVATYWYRARPVARSTAGHGGCGATGRADHPKQPFTGAAAPWP